MTAQMTVDISVRALSPFMQRLERVSRLVTRAIQDAQGDSEKARVLFLDYLRHDFRKRMYLRRYQRRGERMGKGKK